MFLAHSFRLRDPWQCEHGEDGTVCWSRVFHRPTGLEDDDALWLVCSGLPAGAAVSLNNTALASPRPDGPKQFDVTALLADANRIEIRIPSAVSLPTAHCPLPTAFPYDVRLGVVGHS